MNPRRVAVPAGQLLRAYWGTAVALVAACATALAAVLPAATLAGPGAGLPTRLAVPRVGGVDWGLAWGEFARSPDAIRAGKKLLNAASLVSIDEGLRTEESLQRSLIGAANQIEAVQANMQKRVAQFADPE